MTNDEIAAHVHDVVAAVLKGAPIATDQDRAAVDAGVALAVNLLQNINTIAIAAKANVAIGKAHGQD